MARLVFDSEQGRVCPECERPVAACVCAPAKAPTGDGVIRVRREKRAGKVVTVAVGFALPPADLRKLAKELKRRFGTGGSVDANTIELQGDYREPLVEELSRRRLRAVAAGG